MMQLFDRRFSQKACDIQSAFVSEDFGEWAGGFVLENSLLEPSLAETWKELQVAP